MGDSDPAPAPAESAPPEAAVSSTTEGKNADTVLLLTGCYSEDLKHPNPEGAEFEPVLMHPGRGFGMQSVRVNLKTGEFSKKTSQIFAAPVSNPMYITSFRHGLAPEQVWESDKGTLTVVYAAHEKSMGEEGAISSWLLDEETDTLTFLNVQRAIGSPVHLTVHPSGRFLLAACYSGVPSIVVFPLSKIDPAQKDLARPGLQHVETYCDIICFTGKLEHSAAHIRQDGPHPHACYVVPNEPERVLVLDLGLDRIAEYQLDLALSDADHRCSIPWGGLEKERKDGDAPHCGGGKLKLIQTVRAEVRDEIQELPIEQPAAGPRHLAWHPFVPYLCFIANELDSSISLMSVAESDLMILCTVDTLPSDYRRIDRDPWAKRASPIQLPKGEVQPPKRPNVNPLKPAGMVEVDDQGNIIPEKKIQEKIYAEAGISHVADIHVSPFGEGEFVFVSNRGHDSISVFKLDVKAVRGVCEEGVTVLEAPLLAQIQCVKTGGKVPRSFAIHQRGDALVVGNQESDQLACFRVCKYTGKLCEMNTQEIPVNAAEEAEKAQEAAGAVEGAVEAATTEEMKPEGESKPEEEDKGAEDGGEKGGEEDAKSKKEDRDDTAGDKDGTAAESGESKEADENSESKNADPAEGEGDETEPPKEKKRKAFPRAPIRCPPPPGPVYVVSSSMTTGSPTCVVMPEFAPRQIRCLAVPKIQVDADTHEPLADQGGQGNNGVHQEGKQPVEVRYIDEFGNPVEIRKNEAGSYVDQDGNAVEVAKATAAVTEPAAEESVPVAESGEGGGEANPAAVEEGVAPQDQDVDDAASDASDVTDPGPVAQTSDQAPPEGC